MLIQTEGKKDRDAKDRKEEAREKRLKENERVANLPSWDGKNQGQGIGRE